MNGSVDEELVMVLERLARSKKRDVAVLAREALSGIASTDCKRRAIAADAAIHAIRMMSGRMRRAIGEKHVERALEAAVRARREAKKCVATRNAALLIIYGYE